MRDISLTPPIRFTKRRVGRVVPLSFFILSGCGSNLTLNLEGRQRTIVVPTHAVVQPEQRSDGTPPPRKYVVRMSDGQLDWEVELPEVATGYELRIPFRGERSAGAGGISYENGAPLTRADQELISSLRRTNPDMEGEGVYDDQGRGVGEAERAQQAQKSSTQTTDQPADRPPTTTDQGQRDPRSDAQPARTRQSYLVGLEKARQLFNARKYELAIIALKSLDEDYPNDITIKSMLGTLWLQLNQPTLAREAWEAALKIDPNNRSVIQALKQLEQATAGTSAEQDVSTQP